MNNEEKDMKETSELSDVDAENTAENTEQNQENELQKQLDEQNDKYLRLYAEYENFRKRSAKEKTDTYNDAFTDVVTSFLPLLDNLERALQYEPENQGFIMITKQLNDIFAKLGVEEIKSDGEEFDPNLHNAIAHEDDEEKGENIITQTFQKGYTLNGKVIRHAVVKVCN